MFYYDFSYFYLILPALVLSLIAQFAVKNAYKKRRKEREFTMKKTPAKKTKQQTNVRPVVSKATIKDTNKRQAKPCFNPWSVSIYVYWFIIFVVFISLLFVIFTIYMPFGKFVMFIVLLFVCLTH